MTFGERCKKQKEVFTFAEHILEYICNNRLKQRIPSFAIILPESQEQDFAWRNQVRCLYVQPLKHLSVPHLAKEYGDEKMAAWNCALRAASTGCFH
jgi:hypothetical protein